MEVNNGNIQHFLLLVICFMNMNLIYVKKTSKEARNSTLYTNCNDYQQNTVQTIRKITGNFVEFS